MGKRGNTAGNGREEGKAWGKKEEREGGGGMKERRREEERRREGRE